jgi:acetyl esterase
MALDAGTLAFLDAVRSGGGKPLDETSIDEIRRNIRNNSLQLGPPSTELHDVRDRVIPGPGGNLPVRIYTPRALAAGETLPIVVHYHGAGWIAGDLDTHDAIARYYSKHADAIVVAVDYRLGPEHKFPSAVDDCDAATVWAATHASEINGDASRLAVTGDSAGGNIAAAVCQIARDRGTPAIALQVLLYPVIDLALPGPYASRTEFGGGDYFLSTRDMAFFGRQYLTDLAADARDIRASPGSNPNLANLPPAVIVTAGYDPLRDEAKLYADRLAAAGVRVEYHCFETTVHAFVSFTTVIPTGLEALAFIAGRMKAALHATATTKA